MPGEVHITVLRLIDPEQDTCVFCAVPDHVPSLPWSACARHYEEAKTRVEEARCEAREVSPEDFLECPTCGALQGEWCDPHVCGVCIERTKEKL